MKQASISCFLKYDVQISNPVGASAKQFKKCSGAHSELAHFKKWNYNLTYSRRRAIVYVILHRPSLCIIPTAQAQNAVWLACVDLLLTMRLRIPMCFKRTVEDMQGRTLWCALGSVNMRWKSCVLLPAAGRRTQFFLLIFTEPIVHHKVHSCIASIFVKVIVTSI